MDKNRLTKANKTLQIQNSPKSKRLLWIIIGIITGIILIVVAIILWWLKSSSSGPFSNSNTYPYIPVPKNTVRSTSIPDLIGNLILDTNETGIDYSVISRTKILHKFD